MLAVMFVIYYKRSMPALYVPSCSGCNVVIIDVDPLRADSIYRFDKFSPLTPTINALAGSGFYFTNAFTVSSWTLPSAMSLLTGVYPSVHGIINKDLIGQTSAHELVPAVLGKVSPDIVTLSSVLKNNGYVTGGFAGGAALDPSYGFSQGFDTYQSPGEFEGLTQSISDAVAFARTHKNEKLFLFIQGFDTHGQYTPAGGITKKYADPKYHGSLTGSTEEQKALREQGVIQGSVSLTSEDANFLRAIYQEKVADMDQQVKRFLDAYRSIHTSNKTIYIFLSDHGEEFYEHGRIDHGMTLYDEVLHVPLIIAVPGGSKNIKISDQVRNIDIFPTITALTGVKISDSLARQFEGVSLIPTMEGKNQRLDLYAETAYRYATLLAAIRTWDGWKFIYDRNVSAGSLYNLHKDPGELTDIGDSVTHPKAQELMTLLMSFLNGVPKR